MLEGTNTFQAEPVQLQDSSSAVNGQDPKGKENSYLQQTFVF
jgi:hypothetical protein